MKKDEKKKSARPAYSGRSSAVKGPNKRPKEKKDRLKQRNLRLAMLLAGAVLFLALAGGFARSRMLWKESAQETGAVLAENGGPERWQQEGAPYIDVQLLTPNAYSRPQIAVEQVRSIAIHYTANPGSTAMANRNYFENLASTGETKVSSHFVVGLEGEVVQCIPTSEMSYATNSANVDSVSIECCHMDETGVFQEATYDSVVKLAAWLCTRFGLTEENVIRHYDVSGKICPKYYVEHPEAWSRMKEDIAARIQEDHVLQENLNNG